MSTVSIKSCSVWSFDVAVISCWKVVSDILTCCDWFIVSSSLMTSVWLECMWQISSVEHVCNVDMLPWKINYTQMVLLQMQEHSLQLFGCTKQWLLKIGISGLWSVSTFITSCPSMYWSNFHRYTLLPYSPSLFEYIAAQSCQWMRCVCYCLAWL